MISPRGNACEKSRPGRCQLRWAARQKQLYNFMSGLGTGAGRHAGGTLYGSTLSGSRTVQWEKAETVYKSLSRAVKDIWENGDRQALERAIGYHLLEEPTPKELVMSLAQALWCQELAVEYHLLESGLEQKVGVWARSGDDDYLVMQPFSRDRETVCRLVEQWNKEQMPIQKFREMILLGELMKF